MRRRAMALTASGLLLAACAGGPRVVTGPDADRTPDGLHPVEGVPVGTLFLKPDYVFGSYESFSLGPTQVTFERGADVLGEEEVRELTAIFEAVAREAIVETGRREVPGGGPCVARVNLALVDLNLERGSGTMGAASLGAVTLVLEIRDGHTHEALLRFGERRRLSGSNLAVAFKRYASQFQRDFERALPREPAGETVGCRERAGA